MRGLWIELELSLDAAVVESGFSAGLEGYQIAIFEKGFVHDLNFVMIVMVVVWDI